MSCHLLLGKSFCQPMIIWLLHLYLQQLAQLLRDPTVKVVLHNVPNDQDGVNDIFDEAQLDTEWVDYPATGPKCREVFTDLRSLLVNMLSKFRTSGMGDCPEEKKVEQSLSVYSGNVQDFCRGKPVLLYTYAILVHYGLLSSASTDMPTDAAHNSSTTRAVSGRLPANLQKQKQQQRGTKASKRTLAHAVGLDYQALGDVVSQVAQMPLNINTTKTQAEHMSDFYSATRQQVAARQQIMQMEAELEAKVLFYEERVQGALQNGCSPSPFDIQRRELYGVRLHNLGQDYARIEGAQLPQQPQQQPPLQPPQPSTPAPNYSHPNYHSGGCSARRTGIGIGIDEEAATFNPQGGNFDEEAATFNPGTISRKRC